MFMFLIFLVSVIFVSGCVSDSDGDGYADDKDAFPEDDRYHSDYDRDGYADEIDEYPTEYYYHIKCSNCGGDGIVTKLTTKTVRFNIDAASMENTGFFNPNYFFYITVTNIDSHEGTFDVIGYAEDNGVKMWEDSKGFFIGSGETHQFILNYDADEEMDSFDYDVIAPTYVQKEEVTCPKCGGTGKR
ncbi:hypothetical protein BHR79_08310 [Methanohalophilus halophilus]|nr:hypothetical protein BHR79_08310 [Methanohalophilus halophilus]